MKFYVGWIVSYGVNSVQQVIEWFRAENREMSNWINETAGDQWSLSFDEEFADGDEWAPPNSFVTVFVEYQDEQHAVLHKLRWS